MQAQAVFIASLKRPNYPRNFKCVARDAFFGGRTANVMELCKVIIDWQDYNKNIGHEPGVNDESYINKYFHHNPPKTVPIENFPFVISDKGGIDNTREPNLDISGLVSDSYGRRNSLWDIKFNKIV